MDRPNNSMPTLRDQENQLRENIILDRKLMFTTPPPNSRYLQTTILHNDDQSEKRDRRKTALNLKRRRSTLLPSPRKKLREIEIESEAPLPVLPSLSVEEINRRYEEWMKIAADNKINTTNTWNFELIDYFSKLSFFRDGNTINFQKASCTLDGCVKIYTSRVDSVVSETGILLNGLTESSAQKTRALVEEFEEGNSEKPKKKTSRSEVTLAKDFSSLNAKNFELDFSVDPLFKKTCADFDEGGARGLLLNHLPTQGNGRLIFDASDATLATDSLDQAETPVTQERAFLNLGPLIDRFFEGNDSDKQLCPSLTNFQFGSSLSLDLNDLKHLQDENYEASDGVPDIGEDHEDFFDEPTGINGDMSFATFAQQAIDEPVDNEPHSDEQNDQENVVLQPKAGILAESDNIFSYFDSRFVKNWSGPEHWKLKPIPRVDSGTPSSQEPKTKVEKSLFEIDFLNPNSKVDMKTIFVTGDASIENIKLLDKSEESYVLPEDHHFFSNNFLSLFTKPGLSLKHKIKTSQSVSENEFDPLGEHFDAPQNIDYDLPEDNLYESEQSAPPASALSTQSSGYQSLDNPESLFEMNTTFIEKEINSLNFGDQLIPTLKRIQSVRVNYMKIAKRVDVRALKENLWNQLTPAPTPELEADEESDNQIVKSELPEPLVFSSVVKSLSSVYEPKKFQDLSVPFCFICLLHLANEHNLEIENNLEMSELVIKKEPESLELE